MRHNPLGSQSKKLRFSSGKLLTMFVHFRTIKIWNGDSRARNTKLCSRSRSGMFLSHIRQRQTRFDVCKTPNSCVAGHHRVKRLQTAMFASAYLHFQQLICIHLFSTPTPQSGVEVTDLTKQQKKKCRPAKPSSGEREQLSNADRKSPLSLNDVNCLQLKNEQLFSFCCCLMYQS